MSPRMSLWKFETFVGADGQHYFRIVAGNGEPVAVSEGYQRKADMLDTINAIRAEVSSALVVEVEK
jgi:uncharacterized protein YegP (UPF0339 family)